MLKGKEADTNIAFSTQDIWGEGEGEKEREKFLWRGIKLNLKKKKKLTRKRMQFLEK